MKIQKFDTFKENLSSENMKKTELGKSYWDGTGAYQEDYNKLYNELVPVSGESESFHGELLRAISRLYYDYCNNGNCNARETNTEYETYSCSACGGSGDDDEESCEECGGSGEIEEEIEGDAYVNEHFSYFLEFIENNVPNTSDDIYNIERIIINTPDDFSDENMHVYDTLVDKIMYFILTTDNEIR